MTQLSSRTLLAFVSDVTRQSHTFASIDLNSSLDKSIQSAGAAGVWRADAMKVPYVAQSG